MKNSHSATKILVIYDSGKYIEEHSVKKGKILPGKPLSTKVFNDIVSISYNNIIGEKKLKGIIPPHLLYFNVKPLEYIWMTVPQQKMLYFTEALKIPDGIAPIPGLIFRLKADSLKVYTYLKFQREKTDLYRAPFHNVGNNGDVCLGNSYRGKASELIENELLRYENIFFRSKFSETHGETLAGNININLFWKKLIEGKSNKFPYKSLIPLNIKLEEII